MDSLTQLISSHSGFLTGATAFWVYSAAIHALPAPMPNERWYGALYNFLQTVGANLSKIGQKGTPPPAA